MIKIFYENKEFSNQIEYAFRMLAICIGEKAVFINEVKLNDESDSNIIIYYGKSKPERSKIIYIKEGALFSSEIYLKSESLPVQPALRYNNVVAFYGESANVEYSENVVSVGFDIVQSTFFILTNYEDALIKDNGYRDIHGRLSVEKQILFKETYFRRPVINEYAELILEWSRILGESSERNKRTGMFVHLSHDVDYPYEISILSRIKSRITGEPYWKYGRKVLSRGCKLIRRVERENNLTSSWFFKYGGETKFDDCYDLNSKELLDFVGLLKKENCEIGYHYSYNASTMCDEALTESKNVAQILQLDYLCGRNHFLRYQIPDSWRIYEKLNLLYDSTQGCAEYEGFSKGICTPYKLYDLYQNRELNVWEIPLIIMDGTLRRKEYRDLTCKQAFDDIMYFAETIKKYNGILSILWHNSSITGRYWKKWYREVYCPIMKQLNSIEIRCLTGKEILEAYKLLDS